MNPTPETEAPSQDEIDVEIAEAMAGVYADTFSAAQIRALILLLERRLWVNAPDEARLLAVRRRMLYGLRLGATLH